MTQAGDGHDHARVGPGPRVSELEVAHLRVEPEVDRRAARPAVVPRRERVRRRAALRLVELVVDVQRVVRVLSRVPARSEGVKEGSLQFGAWQRQRRRAGKGKARAAEACAETACAATACARLFVSNTFSTRARRVPAGRSTPPLSRCLSVSLSLCLSPHTPRHTPRCPARSRQGRERRHAARQDNLLERPRHLQVPAVHVETGLGKPGELLDLVCGGRGRSQADGSSHGGSDGEVRHGVRFFLRTAEDVRYRSAAPYY